jgi:hypothetical protein
VATAEGLYLDKKLDLLLAYCLVGPVSSALARLRAAAGGWLASDNGAAAAGSDAQGQQQQQQLAAAKPPSKVSTASWRNLSVMAESPGADAGDDDELRPFASADLSHQYARLVMRRSLRSQMPGPRQVLAKLFTKLTLLVSTACVAGRGAVGGGAAGGAGAGSSSSACVHLRLVPALCYAQLSLTGELQQVHATGTPACTQQHAIGRQFCNKSISHTRNTCKRKWPHRS